MLHRFLSFNFYRLPDGSVLNIQNESDQKEIEYLKDSGQRLETIDNFDIRLLDADSTDEDNDLTSTIFNYLGEEYERTYFGPGGFEYNPSKFNCLKNGEEVYIPLPKRNLNLYLLISDKNVRNLYLESL